VRVGGGGLGELDRGGGGAGWVMEIGLYGQARAGTMGNGEGVGDPGGLARPGLRTVPTPAKSPTRRPESAASSALTCAGPHRIIPGRTDICANVPQ